MEPFVEDLINKLWITRGARFAASERMLIRSNLSVQAVGFLTAYLIVFGLITTFKFESRLAFSTESIGFISTSLSVLLLLYSQVESSNDYKGRAKAYHECGLEIAEQYNYLKTFMTLTPPETRDTLTTCQSVSERYQSILRRHENHMPIDYDYFKSKEAKLFKLNWAEVLFIKVRFYWDSAFIYHLLMFGLPVGFLLLVLFRHK